VSARLVANELDLNLTALATALFIVIVVVIVGGALARSLDTATLGGGSAIAVRVVEVGRRRLVVLIGDVGHYFSFGAFRAPTRSSKK
jgi:hypothetical protein